MAGPPPISLRQAHLAEIALRGVPVPGYDRDRLEPRIVHVGVGGFHRAHLAVYTHELASDGGDWGIVGLGLLPKDAEMAAALGRQDYLYTLIEKGGGEPSAQVIGSIMGFVHAPNGRDAAVAVLTAAPATSILSLTVTESGYAEPSAAGMPTTFDRIARALAVRRERATGPLTIVSCDNLPGNGTAARRATLAAADRVDAALAGWVQENCTFPNSMVDRITPMTSDTDRAWLRDGAGIDDSWPVVAEPFRQWVIEDEFAAGRPAWENAGALFSDRIEDWELYKLRMLNATHSCMAYLSALAGITFVDQAMATAVRTFLEDLLQREALPTLVEIPGHPREEYAATVLERFANTGVRDQIERLCVDGSAKFATFLIPTIERQLETDGPIERAATALAGWARYLGVVDPEHQAFDADAEVAACCHAAAALADPPAFLDYDAVFPPALHASSRFRAAFSDSYRCVAEEGAIAAMEAEPGRKRARAAP